jgi:cytochrome c biogenesis protein CcmG, thiol:disulfide interchange protein DsbE
MLPTLQKPSAQLALVLLVGGILTFLFSTGDAPAVTRRAAAERKPMMDVQSTDLAGKAWKLDDHRGQVVLVNFWATWCPPCRSETPGLVRLANAYRGKGLEVVGVSMDDNPDPVRPFVDKFHVPYSVVFPPEDSPLNSAVEALPTSFLVDKKGLVAAVYQGAVTETELKAAVDALLREP